MEVIDKANDAHVLMKLLCEKLGLTTKTTHIKFVESFSQIQADASKYQLELKEMFRAGVQKELQKQKEEEAYERTDEYVNGDYK